MIPHQAISMVDTVGSLMGFSEVVNKGFLPFRATIYHMLIGGFIFNALRSGNGESVDNLVLLIKRLDPILFEV